MPLLFIGQFIGCMLDGVMDLVMASTLGPS